MRYDQHSLTTLVRAGLAAALVLGLAVDGLARPKERGSSGSDSDRGSSRSSSRESSGRSGGDSGRSMRSSGGSESSRSRSSGGGSVERSTPRVERSSPRVERSSPRIERSSPRISASSDNPPPSPRIKSGGGGDSDKSARSRINSNRGNPGDSAKGEPRVRELAAPDNSGKGETIRSFDRGSRSTRDNSIGKSADVKIDTNKSGDIGPGSPPPSPLKLGNSKADRGPSRDNQDPTGSADTPNRTVDRLRLGDPRRGNREGSQSNKNDVVDNKADKSDKSSDTPTTGPVLTQPGGENVTTDGRRGRTRVEPLRDLKVDVGGSGATTDAKGREFRSRDNKVTDGKPRLDLDRDKIGIPDRTDRGNPKYSRGRRQLDEKLAPVVERDGVPLKDASKVAFDRHSKEDAEFRKSNKPVWSKHVKHDHDRWDHLDKHHSHGHHKVHFKKQYDLHIHGDVSRQLGLHVHLNSGWDHRHVGHVHAHYRNHTFHRPYWGPSYYPDHCWYPVWSTWVNWSWGYGCDPYWDPRPVICRPIIYRPCATWVYYDYPVWQPLPVAVSGTWVDVPPVVVEQGYDVQLLAVRFVDPGHPEQNQGQRYRAWVRNNSSQAIREPFNVLVMAADGAKPGEDRLEIGQRVESIEPGQTLAVDLRLPLPDAAHGGADRNYSTLHVLVDSHRELKDTNVANNGIVLARKEVLPVDPVLFASEDDVIEAGATVNLAGEGLGPEPGEVLLTVGDKEVPVEILGWYDLGVRVKLPQVALDAASPAQFIVVRGDTAATNPIQVQLVSAAAGQEF